MRDDRSSILPTRWPGLLLVAAALAGCHEDSRIEGPAAGPPWWNQVPPFVVASHSPASGASNVDVCAVVTVTFNRDATPATVDGTTFIVSGSAAGTVAYNAATRTASFTPTGLFAASTLHTVTLTAGILSLTGEPLAPVSFTFTTAGPFARVSSVPAPGTLNVPLNTNITVTFNKDVDAATIQPADFAVTGSSFASHAYAPSTRTLTLFTASNLPPLIPISVTLVGSVLTGDGCAEPLAAAGFDFSFTTGITGDTTPPVFGGAASAVASNAQTVVVSWTAATDNVTPQGSIFYLVYRSALPGGPFALHATTAAGATSFTDGGRTPSTTLYYRVHAVDGSGNEDANVVTQAGTTPGLRSWMTVYTSILIGTYSCQACHPALGGLNLSTQAVAYTDMVNVTGPCGVTRVIPGNSAGSFLYQKVARIQTCGVGMPPPPSSAVSAADVDAIRDWIDEGALNN